MRSHDTYMTLVFSPHAPASTPLVRWALALPCAALLLLVGGCCHQCPESRSPGDVDRWEAALRKKEPLAIHPESDLTVKRDLHEVLVDVSAARYAVAFEQVMTDPQRRFGLIRVDRLRENVGKPFVLGEKFQGRYEVDAAILQRLRGQLEKWFGDIVDSPEVQAWLCDIENKHTSDFGLISRLELQPPPGKDYVLQYRYLEGSPIAGSSTFVVSEVTDPDVLAKYGVTAATRLQQIFEYQETKGSFANFFTRGGLRLHDQVVYSQALQAAQAAGGKVLMTDIPEEYQQEP